MKVKTGLIAVAVLTPMLFLSGHALAEAGSKFKGCHHETTAGFAGALFERPERIERMFKKLDLEQDQQEKIRGILESKRDTRDVLAGQLSDSRKQMQALRGSDYDAQKFNQLARQHADSMAALMMFNYELRHLVREELTPEQQAVMQERMEKRMEKMKERRQERKHRSQDKS